MEQSTNAWSMCSKVWILTNLTADPTAEKMSKRRPLASLPRRGSISTRQLPVFARLTYDRYPTTSVGLLRFISRLLTHGLPRSNDLVGGLLRNQRAGCGQIRGG